MWGRGSSMWLCDSFAYCTYTVWIYSFPCMKVKRRVNNKISFIHFNLAMTMTIFDKNFTFYFGRTRVFCPSCLMEICQHCFSSPE